MNSFQWSAAAKSLVFHAFFPKDTLAVLVVFNPSVKRRNAKELLVLRRKPRTTKHVLRNPSREVTEIKLIVARCSSDLKTWHVSFSKEANAAVKTRRRTVQHDLKKTKESYGEKLEFLKFQKKPKLKFNKCNPNIQMIKRFSRTYAQEWIY